VGRYDVSVFDAGRTGGCTTGCALFGENMDVIDSRGEAMGYCLATVFASGRIPEEDALGLKKGLRLALGGVAVQVKREDGATDFDDKDSGPDGGWDIRVG
jgi:hypothetical protein